MKFAKIVEVDGEQVLFYIEPDDEADGKEKLHQICRVDGLCGDIALGGLSYESADEALSKIGEKEARLVISTIRGFA